MTITKQDVKDWWKDHYADVIVYGYIGGCAALWVYGVYSQGVKVGKAKGHNDLIKYMAQNHPCEYARMLTKEAVKETNRIRKLH